MSGKLFGLYLCLFAEALCLALCAWVLFDIYQYKRKPSYNPSEHDKNNGENDNPACLPLGGAGYFREQCGKLPKCERWSNFGRLRVFVKRLKEYVLYKLPLCSGQGSFTARFRTTAGFIIHNAVTLPPNDPSSATRRKGDME